MIRRHVFSHLAWADESVTVCANTGFVVDLQVYLVLKILQVRQSTCIRAVLGEKISVHVMYFTRAVGKIYSCLRNSLVMRRLHLCGSSIYL